MGIAKLDEDLAPLVAKPLTERGHEVRTVHGQGWSGIEDHELLVRATDEGAILITADKGFGDIRKYPPGSHRGIILLRADTDSLAEYLELLDALLKRHELSTMARALTVVSPRGIRIRRGGT